LPAIHSLKDAFAHEKVIRYDEQGNGAKNDDLADEKLL